MPSWLLRRLLTSTRPAPNRTHLSRAGPTPAEARPPATVVALIDHAALVRGFVEGEECCIIKGIGPVPVANVRAMLSDAFLAAVVADGVDIRSVVHLGRRPLATQLTALYARDRTCVGTGCESEDYLEAHHVEGLVEHEGDHSRRFGASLFASSRPGKLRRLDPRWPAGRMDLETAAWRRPPGPFDDDGINLSPPRGIRAVMASPDQMVLRQARTATRLACSTSEPNLSFPLEGLAPIRAGLVSCSQLAGRRWCPPGENRFVRHIDPAAPAAHHLLQIAHWARPGHRPSRFGTGAQCRRPAPHLSHSGQAPSAGLRLARPSGSMGVAVSATMQVARRTSLPPNTRLSQTDRSPPCRCSIETEPTSITR